MHFWKKRRATTASSTSNAPNIKTESIDKTFRRAAVFGHCLGLFPCSSVILRENVNPRYLLIPTFVSVILYISSVIGSFFALLLYLQQFRTVHKISLTKTDDFAMKMFLAALLTARSFAPLFCLRKAKAIAILVQNLARYDKTFQIKNTLGFLNFTILFLVLGSVSNAVTNTWVSLPVMYKAYKDDQFPTLFRIFGVKSPVLEYLHTFSGGFYGEIGLLFISSTTVFIGRAITKRVDEIRKSLPKVSSQCHTVQLEEQQLLSGKELTTLIRKMKALFGIKEKFDEIFGSFMVTYVSFSIVILVTTIYCLISFAVSFQGTEANVRPEFLSICSVVLLTCGRITVFMECGEEMLKAVSL